MSKVELRVTLPLYIDLDLPDDVCENYQTLQRIGVDIAIQRIDGISELAATQEILEKDGTMYPADFCEVCTITLEDES